jgi:IS30 family transposase
MSELGKVREMLPLPAVTRVTVVSDRGVEFEKYNLFENGVEVHLQDDGRTLKIFPRSSDG